MNSLSRAKKWFRRIGPLVALLAGAALALSLAPWRLAPAILPSLSPFIAASSLLARTAGLLTLLALPGLLLAIVRRRWMCRYVCPVGLINDTLARLRPRATPRWLRWPAIGQWLALATLGGACVGYPLLLWLDPLAMLNGVFGIGRGFTWAAVVAASVLPAVILLTLLWPGAWCRRLCPLGGMQDWLHALAQWRRCPRRHTLTSPDSVRSADEGVGATGGGTGVVRRTVLCAGIGAGIALATKPLRGRSPHPLRPPGSIDEASFVGVCVRCGNCARCCPAGIIAPDLSLHGIAGLLAPTLHFDADYCREDCNRCGDVCPSGAIARLSRPDKARRVIGVTQLDLSICRLADGGECTACITRCPYQAIHIETTDGGFSTQPRVDPALCNGCGACEAVCPVRPRRAIQIIPQA